MLIFYSFWEMPGLISADNYSIKKRKNFWKLYLLHYSVSMEIMKKRPYTILTYKEKIWNGGIIYYEEAYPSLLFAKDGEVYELNEKQTIVALFRAR